MNARQMAFAVCLVLVITVVAYTDDKSAEFNSTQAGNKPEQNLGQLEARIARLEQAVFGDDSQTAVHSPPMPVPPKRKTLGDGPWQDLAHWSRIKKGMSPAQVFKIIGPPSRMGTHMTVESPPLFHWEGYVEAAGAHVSGYVKFDIGGQVTQVSPPVW